MTRKNTLALCAASFLFCTFVYAQSITTAGDYFKTISEFYGTIKTYEADFDMSVGNRSMYGHVSFKRPDLLRMDFTSPANQVIAYNGDMLTIYLPDTSAVLQQSVQDDGGASLATPLGLSLMSRYYTVAYDGSTNASMIESVPDEAVMNLILYRRNANESFRSIKLAIGVKSKLIRRIEALSAGAETFVFLFSNYTINGDIPDQRFIYDAPSSANIYNNFLFSE